MMMKGKEFRKKQSWPNLRYYVGTGMEGLRKTMRNLSRDNRPLGPRFRTWELPNTRQEC
jgi:hypothetical protein